MERTTIVQFCFEFMHDINMRDKDNKLATEADLWHSPFPQIHSH